MSKTPITKICIHFLSIFLALKQLKGQNCGQLKAEKQGIIAGPDNPRTQN